MQPLFIDIEVVCAKLGIDLRKKGNYSVGLCPLHTERDPSFTVYSSNTFYCFGCKVGGGPFELVSRLVDGIRTWSDLYRWYSAGGTPGSVIVKSAPSLDRIRELMRPEVVLPNATRSQDPFLASLGILFIKEGKLAGRHIIPITLDGKLVAYEARSFIGRLVPKTLILPREVPIHSYLWNIDNVVVGFPIIIVEGIKGAIAVLNYGYVNVVSSFGARLTPDQVSLLMLKSPPEVVIAYDADNAGIGGASRAILSLLAWTRVSRVKLPAGTDPWDVSKSVWEECFVAREGVFVGNENKKVLEDLKKRFFL
jgi:hypothetical protein